MNSERTHGLDPRGNILFSHTIVIGGQVIGAWKRTLKKDVVVIEAKFIAPLKKVENKLFVAAAQRYAGFLDRTVVFEK